MSEAHNHETPSIPFEDLPDRLRRSRKRAGWDQEEIADRLGIHRRTVANYEGGKTEPGRALLVAWASLTHVPVEWLTYGLQACPSCGRTPEPDGGGAITRRTCFSTLSLVSGLGEGGDAPRPELTAVGS